MAYDIKFETQSDDRLLAVVRRRATGSELPRVVPEACGFVWNALRTNPIRWAGRHVAVYVDDQINLEVGVEIDESFAGCGDVIASCLPAGSIATTVHLGPYGGLRHAHQAIQEWAATHGHALAGPCWEIYGHWVDEWNHDPSKIRTDVCYLLKSIKG